MRTRVVAVGLNRTSVGLKRWSRGFSFRAIMAPQSNQRGIETEQLSLDAIKNPLPQSNQRGIETIITQVNQHRLGLASIEPAWD